AQVGDGRVEHDLEPVRLRPLHPQQLLPGRGDRQPEHRARRAGRLRVRAAPVPRTRAAVLARAGDADGPRPAAPDPRLRAADELAPDRELLRVHRDQPRARDQSVLHAPVLPHDPEGLRGGREARRRRALQDLLEGNAAARGTGDRGAHDPAVPGHVERLLLAADHLRPGDAAPLHSAARPRAARPDLPDELARADGRERDRDPADPARLPRLPALLHRRDHGCRSEGMSARAALRLAVCDLYAQSWRLVLVNAALGLALVVALLLAAASPVALVLVALTGPLAAALVHCAVTLVREGDLRPADAVAGVPLHWR